MPILIKGSGKVPKLQTKTATPNTIKVKVLPDSGYDGLSQVTISAIKLQAKTATPSSSSSVVTPDAAYTGLSKVTVSGDSNLTAANIKSGVSIFGVSGTYSGGAKVYVARYITPTSITKPTSAEWTSGTQLSINASDITKLFDASNSGDAFPTSLYGTKPKALMVTFSSLYGIGASPPCVSHFDGYNSTGNKYTGKIYYSGYSGSLNSSSSTQYLECASAPSSGNIILSLYMSVSASSNMLTSKQYDVYLIY